MASFHLFAKLPPEVRTSIWAYSLEYRIVDETGLATTVPAQTEHRYTWINFEMDMIDIGTDDLYYIKHVASRIRRLMLEQDNAEEGWYHWEGHELIDFRNIEVIHVLSPHPLAGWADAWTERYWCREKENLKFIDKATGQVAGVDEVYAMPDAG
ncbi:hypothetical protein NLG97_g2502 [Lecanicillium saksenae]|uniref:Uncharacterized protein n=1 Tax=Lecanicillium saksenae TaxID=468837 RepID=A0ACC1R0T8_9HYPO|nr:hypothetical protein NLG97_g2502 [Lecanicillium saksenae]